MSIHTSATRRLAAITVVTALLCLAACHKRPVVPPPAPPPLDLRAIENQFEQLINRGCYLCLDDVLRQYRALPETARHSELIQPVATRAALLFLFRRKELGIPQDDDWTSAETIVGASASSSPSLQVWLEVEQATTWNALGVGEGFLDEQRRPLPSTPQRQAWRAALEAEWPQSDIAAYVYLSLVCGWPQAPAVDLVAVKEQYPASALIQYRWATCRNPNEATLRKLLQADSRFIEIRYFLARGESSARQFADAETDFFDAWHGIPRFTASAISAAELALTSEEYDRTLETVDAVLAIAPNHWRGALDKVRALSFIARHGEAIDVATRLISAGHWYQGDAHYWRAWNQYQLDRFEPAIEDVRAAKEYEPRSVRVYTLGGLVRMKQERWQDAKGEFLTALDINPDVCDVHYYLGFTDSSLSEWKEAAAYFERAAGCFASVEQGLQTQILMASRRPATDTWAIREVARLRRDLATTVEQEHSAIYNTAVTFANARMVDQARQYAKVAETFPAYADRVKTLMSTIDERK